MRLPPQFHRAVRIRVIRAIRGQKDILPTADFAEDTDKGTGDVRRTLDSNGLRRRSKRNPGERTSQHPDSWESLHGFTGSLQTCRGVTGRRELRKFPRTRKSHIEFVIIRAIRVMPFLRLTAV